MALARDQDCGKLSPLARPGYKPRTGWPRRACTACRLKAARQRPLNLRGAARAMAGQAFRRELREGRHAADKRYGFRLAKGGNPELEAGDLGRAGAGSATKLPAGCKG